MPLVSGSLHLCQQAACPATLENRVVNSTTGSL